MSEVELKPCPFCGNPAVVYQIPKEENPDWFKGGDFWNVKCSNPYCYMLGNTKYKFSEKGMAIAEWNTRRRKNKLTFAEMEETKNE